MLSHAYPCLISFTHSVGSKFLRLEVPKQEKQKRVWRKNQTRNCCEMGKLNFPNHLLALNGGHHGSGSNGLSHLLLLLLLLAGHESGGRKSEDSNLLHNYLTSFDVV